MGRIGLSIAAALVGVAVTTTGTSGSSANPFAFLAPLVSVDHEERATLDAGGTIVKVLRGAQGDIAIFGAVRVQAEGARLLAWMRQIENLRETKYVGAVGRFSDPPRLADLDGAVLDERDLEDIRRCRPGDCGVKLDSAEITRLRRTISLAGPDWKPAVQTAFREIVLERLLAYRAGAPGEVMYDDDHEPVSLRSEFARVMEHSPFLLLHLPHVADYLQAYPHVQAPHGGESFFYWSQEMLAKRPVLSVTHVTVVAADDPRLPEALVVSRQVFATHYTNASLGMTAVPPVSGGRHRYLVYVNRSRVDLLNGPFAGVIRRVIERRVRSEAPAVLDGLRRRLEAGHPAQPGGIRETWGISRD
jgi:hypothetical protein